MGAVVDMFFLCFSSRSLHSSTCSLCCCACGSRRAKNVVSLTCVSLPRHSSARQVSAAASAGASKNEKNKRCPSLLLSPLPCCCAARNWPGAARDTRAWRQRSGRSLSLPAYGPSGSRGRDSLGLEHAPTHARRTLRLVVRGACNPPCGPAAARSCVRCRSAAQRLCARVAPREPRTRRRRWRLLRCAAARRVCCRLRRGRGR
jgi:hypothetical protein